MIRSVNATIRAGDTSDDGFVARCFRQMWLDIGHAPEVIVPDAEARTVRFIEDARARLDFRSGVAVVGGERIGCAAAQRFGGLYPDVMDPNHRRYGYIWGVYVAPDHRRAGIGKRLTAHCVEALRATGCTHAILHAAPMGLRVYQSLGFTPTREHILDLNAGASAASS